MLDVILSGDTARGPLSLRERTSRFLERLARHLGTGKGGTWDRVEVHVIGHDGRPRVVRYSLDEWRAQLAGSR